MTLPVWPATVPYTPVPDGFSMQELASPALSTSFQYGNTRLRNSTTVKLSKQTISLLLTAAEWADFKTFYDTTIARGTSEFTMYVWNKSAFVQKTCMLEGAQIATTEEAPGESSSQLIRVSFTLLIQGL